MHSVFQKHAKDQIVAILETFGAMIFLISWFFQLLKNVFCVLKKSPKIALHTSDEVENLGGSTKDMTFFQDRFKIFTTFTNVSNFGAHTLVN